MGTLQSFTTRLTGSNQHDAHKPHDPGYIRHQRSNQVAERQGDSMSQECESVVQNNACLSCMENSAVQMSRRAFFGSILGVFSGVMAAVIGIPLFRYILYPIQSASKSTNWTNVGDEGEFNNLEGPITKTISLTQRDGWREIVSQQAVFVSRTNDGHLQVLSPVCPHLGCSVAWHANENKFVCPCHGGQFKPDGSRISGPPPRGLDRLEAQVRDGKLEVQFQYFRSNVPNRELLS
jgi:menaquinol-cytochrome c reductase iron-sulfur subunit